MGGRYDTVSFLSDYGTTDEFVGVVHSVIRSIAPQAAVIDISHGIPPHDVRAGGLALVRAVQYMAPGIALAVVDPGVGTARRAVAVEVGESGEGVFIGPDNGLLASAVAMTGGARRAVELTNPEYQLPAPGATFAGRDVFAPAAAHLCNGVPLGEFGPEIDPITLRPGVLPLPHEEDGALTAEVLWIDHYGNAQLNVEPDQIAGLGDRVSVSAGERVRTAKPARAYADLKAGELGLVVDSYGLVSLAMDRTSAAAALKLFAGSEVVLRSPEEG